MRSVMTHTFSQVPRADIPRSSFDRTHGLKTTFDSGHLVPILCDEALPGDTFNVDMTAFIRLSTPLHPFMDNARVDTFFFFVPNRLIWDNWQKFNGEQENPDDSTDYLVPTMTSTAVTGYQPNSLFDYMGLPVLVPGLVHNSLHLRAYNLIYNEWFRDQNLQDSVVVDKDDGPDSPTDYQLLRRGKRHDYFTSALPWPQKGPAVDLPLGTVAPVVATAVGASGPTFKNTAAGITARNLQFTSGNQDVQWNSAPGATNSAFWDTTGLQADLTAATAATINQLRQAFQIQKLYERDARGGTRYTEIIRSHFGVVSPDARLQRPEYLGGGTTALNVTPVVQNSASTAESPQGNLAAFGTAAVRRNGFTKSFTEHGVILGLLSVRADLTYQQGLNRMWSRQTRWDFYWPALSHIGEQAVLNKEIYAQGSAAPTVDADVFGYQERYAEYRYKPSQITGTFRSQVPNSLDTWHLAQEFSAVPVLNDEFIEENPPFERVLAITEDEPQFIGDFYFQMRCARPMPVYGVPGLIDHF